MMELDAADPRVAVKDDSRVESSSSALTLLEEGLSVYVKFEFAVLESDLTPYEKLVWCAIASFNGFARLNPTENQISKRCRVSPRQVRRAVKSLEKVGLIGRIGREYKLADADQWSPKAAHQTEQVAQQSLKQAQQSPIIEDTSTQKILNPSRQKQAREVDPRHHQVRKMIDYAYRMKNGFSVQWGGREAKLLSTTLASLPDWTAEDFGVCIEARFLSEANHASVPKNWISELPSYRKGPLDRYGKPKEDKYADMERAFGKSGTADGADVSPETDGGRNFRLS